MPDISLIDIKRQYLSIKDEIDSAISNVISDMAFIGNKSNKYIKTFEERFATYNNSGYCIACANGTDSLEIALKSLDIGYGDEVIIPALSWFSTSEAVSNIGAKPVFVDIKDNTFNIDETKIEDKITQHTKAILPVHLYGLPANMPAILEIANKYNLYVVEDCAQAHGSEINGRKVGNFGHFGSFSFFPGKNLGAFGDAGGLVTNSIELAEKASMIAQHGMKEKKHVHYIEGRNSRMDGIQAAILSVKLHYLPEWIEKRIQIAKEYGHRINNSVIILPFTPDKYKHSYHLFTIKTNHQKAAIEYLNTKGISSSIMYPTPLPMHEAYKYYGYKESDFPVAVKTTKEIISVPMFPELTNEEIDSVSNALNSFHI